MIGLSGGDPVVAVANSALCFARLKNQKNDYD